MSEELVNQALDQSNKREAVRQLYEMIVDAAGRRDFAKAERLRERLLAVDNMALTEIIGSAEAIEAAKTAAIDPSYNEQWQELRAQLDEEENNALFFALKEASLKPGTAFVEQGKLNNRLFFISQGRVTIVCRMGDQKFLLQNLDAGEIAGEDTFFGISIATASVVCQSPVSIRYLERKSMDQWQETAPSLEEKLRSYCQAHCSLDHAQAAKKVERRQKKRYPLEAPLNAQLQNLKGQDIGVSFRGILDDISEGGVCFYIKTPQQSTARMLLGRPVHLTFTLGKVEMSLHGLIVSAKYHLHNDYTVHVKLTNSDDPILRQLVGKLEAQYAGR